jgi:hypothetical protein
VPAGIELEGENLAGPRREHAGQDAAPRPDLHHTIARPYIRQRHDLFGDARGGQKTLAERLPRAPIRHRAEIRDWRGF